MHLVGADSYGAVEVLQISILYQIISRIAPNPMVTLNHAVAVAMTRGPRAGLEMLETLDGDDRSGTARPGRDCWTRLGMSHGMREPFLGCGDGAIVLSLPTSGGPPP